MLSSAGVLAPTSPRASVTRPRPAPWPQQLAAADGRRTSHLPVSTSAVRLRHSWRSAETPHLDLCCLQYDADGRRVRGGNVDRLYTRTEWQARTGEWRHAAQYSETSGASELTVWLHNVAPTVRSLFIVLSAATPLRTLSTTVLARDNFDLSAMISGGPGQADGEALLYDGLQDMSWWRRMAIDRRASDDTALVLCRLWRSSRGETSAAHDSSAVAQSPCSWVFEEMTVGMFGRVGVSADHYAPIYATLDAWVSAQPPFFCAEDHTAAAAAAAAAAPIGDRLHLQEPGDTTVAKTSSQIGRIVLRNGDVYVGEWRGDGERHGQGSYIWTADGSRYDGGWVSNRREGPRGRMRYGNGDVYQGEWQSDKKWGRGVMYLAGGGSYEGEWVNDQMDGEGTMMYRNGDVYEGSFRKGLRHGRGRYQVRLAGPDGTRAGTPAGHSQLAILTTAAADDIGGGVYSGDWVDDVQEGKGVMLYADGTQYSGSWLNGKRHGQGEISYSHKHGRNEVRYSGEWINDVRQGTGQMKHAGTGATYNGGWAGRQRLAMLSSGRVASEALFRHLEPNRTEFDQERPPRHPRPQTLPQSPSPLQMQPQTGSVAAAAWQSRAVTNTASPAAAEPLSNRRRSSPQQRRPSPPLLHRQTQEHHVPKSTGDSDSAADVGTVTDRSVPPASTTTVVKMESVNLQHSIDGGMTF